MNSTVLFKNSVWEDPDTLAALLDANGRIVDLNQAMADRLGGTVAALKGKEIGEYLAHEKEAHCEAALRRVLKSGKTERFEEGGFGKWYESVLRPCRGRNGELLGVSMLSWDTTSLHGANESLSEQRLRFTLQSTNVGMWEFDLASGKAWRSPEHAQIFGYPDTSKPWHYSDFLRHVIEDDRLLVDQTIKAGLQAKKGWTFECRIRREDGQERWIWSNCGLKLDATGKPVWASGVIMDITERKLAQLARQESEARFAAVANSAPVLIWMSGVDKLCDFFNQPWLEFTGRTMQQELGNGWAEGVHPDDMARCLEIYVGSFDGRRPFQMEYRLRRRDGEYRWVLDHGVPRYAEGGRFVGYIGSCIDVTDQKLDRDTLARVGGELRTILETVPSGVSLIKDRRIVWSNAAHDRLLGYERGKTAGLDMASIYAHPQDYVRVGRDGYAALTHGDSYASELEIKRGDGSAFWCSIHGRAVNPANLQEGSIWTIVDITQSRLAAEKLKESEHRFMTMFRSSPIPAVISRLADGVFWEVNDAGLQLYGYSRADVEGHSAVELGIWPLPKEREALMGRLKAEGTVRGFEATFRCKSGAIGKGLVSAATFEINGERHAIGMVLDITESRLHQQEIEHQGALIQTILNSIPDIVFFKNQEGIYSHCNTKLTQALGRTKEQILGKTDSDLFSKAAADGYRMDDQKVLASSTPLHLEEPLTLPDGSLRFVDTLKARVLSSDGEVLGILGVARDVTERKKMEEALRQSDQMQRTILSAMVEGVVFQGADGAIINCNDSAEQILGLSRDQMMGLTSMDQRWRAIREDGSDYPGADHPAMVCLRTGKGCRDALMGLNLPDGSLRWISINSEPLFRLDQERPYAVITSFADITQRRMTEDALRVSEQRHRLLFDNAGDLMMVVSVEHRILAVNTKATQQLGYTRDQLLSMSIPQIVAEEITPLLPGIVEDVQRQGGLIHESILKRKDGSLMPVENHSHLVDWGNQGACLVICRDLTDRKQMEERLRQSQKMEAIGHLAGGMAHEFNNILASMMLNLSLVKIGGEVADQQQMLDDLEASCTRSADLIKQLLAFSRQSLLSKQSLHLGEVVVAQARTLKPFLGERIRLEIVSPDDLPLVNADKTLIEQVLLNLCLNARDAMRDAGLLRIEIGVEAVGLERTKANSEARPGQFVRLSVTDTGCGMDEAVKKRLFEPFFTTKEVGKGTGLGLATVRGIVQQHQGWVEVDSEPGRGSTFTVYLQAVELAAPPARTAAPPAAKTSSGGGTILVAEDDTKLRRLSVLLLKRQGFKVLEADDGASAMLLWAAHRHEIDLLYSDMVMPGEWSGLQLAERFRAEKPSIKVIITSGYNTDMVDLEKAAAASIAYLPKPCPPDILLGVVSRCLQEKAGGE